jgi:hypothetical protein
VGVWLGLGCGVGVCFAVGVRELNAVALAVGSGVTVLVALGTEVAVGALVGASVSVGDISAPSVAVGGAGVTRGSKVGSGSHVTEGVIVSSRLQPASAKIANRLRPILPRMYILSASPD